MRAAGNVGNESVQAGGFEQADITRHLLKCPFMLAKTLQEH